MTVGLVRRGIMSFHEPLMEHTRFRKVKDINAGSFGFVQLAVDLEHGEQVRVEFDSLPRVTL